MRNVVWSLMPVVAFAIYSFGLDALLLVFTTAFACVATEHTLCRLTGKSTTITDWSALITGLLLGLTLPPAFPLWMAFIGGVVAIGLGKFAFGGLGYNVFNPALVGRVVLQAAFPVSITTWSESFSANRFTQVSDGVLTFPFLTPKIEGFTGATPLSAYKFDGLSTPAKDLALGLVSGSAGETCSWIIILSGLYLVIRNMMNWRIPISILLTVTLFSALLRLFGGTQFPHPGFMLFSGGLMLGAVFMASDMVASPVTPLGIFIYGILIGALIVIIRIWGGQPEGVMYAILLGNAVSPHIDRMVKPRVYGT